jgi:hypothetical protein
MLSLEQHHQHFHKNLSNGLNFPIAKEKLMKFLLLMIQQQTVIKLHVKIEEKIILMLMLSLLLQIPLQQELKHPYLRNPQNG